MESKWVGISSQSARQERRYFLLRKNLLIRSFRFRLRGLTCSILFRRISSRSGRHSLLSILRLFLRPGDHAFESASLLRVLFFRKKVDVGFKQRTELETEVL